MKKIALFAAFLAFLGLAQAQEPRRLLVFFSPGCHECIRAKETILKDVERDFKSDIVLEYRDIGEMENYKLFLSLKEQYTGDRQMSVPVFFFEGRLFTAAGLSKEAFYALLKEARDAPLAEGSVSVDLNRYLATFRPLAVASAGLVDGINPCAFTVIVFFISFLSLQGYRKREMAVIGLAFIFAVFVTYILIGLGLFNFLYRMRGFALLTRMLNLGIGLFSVVLGVLAIADFIKFKKTKNSEGMFLQLPKPIKDRIHSVIGRHYRKTGSTSGPRPVLNLVLSALATGFLVSLLEAVCTGQMYLPTIAFVLKSTGLQLRAVSYLLAYNIMFIIPLLAVFLLALLGATSAAFALFMKKHMGSIKILMSIMFLGLGAFLLWRG